jgi:hypothetical protein
MKLNGEEDFLSDKGLIEIYHNLQTCSGALSVLRGSVLEKHLELDRILNLESIQEGVEKAEEVSLDEILKRDIWDQTYQEW